MLKTVHIDVSRHFLTYVEKEKIAKIFCSFLSDANSPLLSGNGTPATGNAVGVCFYWGSDASGRRTNYPWIAGFHS